MDYILPAAIILGIIVVVLLIKVIKGFIKIMFYGILILIIMTGVFSYFMYKDVNDLSTSLTSKKNLFLLRDNTTVFAGFSMQGLNLSNLQEVSQEQITAYNTLYMKQDYKHILESNYKLIIIDKKAFPVTGDFNPESIFEYLKSDKSFQLNTNLPSTKAIAFSYLVIYSLKKDPAFLVKEYKKGNVMIYPETFMFKVVKFFAKGK